MTHLATPNKPLEPPKPPTAALWAPRLRCWLTKFFARMDRRKAAQLAKHGQNERDYEWLAAYDAWWTETGWELGYPSPDQRWKTLMRERYERRLR